MVVRSWIDGQVGEIEGGIDHDKKKAHPIEIVVDRLVPKPEVKNRLIDWLATINSEVYTMRETVIRPLP